MTLRGTPQKLYIKINDFSNQIWQLQIKSNNLQRHIYI